jgi:hypothetical protein
MMGLPENFLNVEGVSRKEKMMMCGNGVVAQQAEVAISQLLKIVEEQNGSR